mmetsp:Transcript_37633/g.88587  ORF Transcript_37633/g.88587 Transcript_37633/m.88587 type:complete len:289 (-) Transcript_37633:1302-2168(-)
MQISRVISKLRRSARNPGGSERPGICECSSRDATDCGESALIIQNRSWDHANRELLWTQAARAQLHLPRRQVPPSPRGSGSLDGLVEVMLRLVDHPLPLRLDLIRGLLRHPQRLRVSQRVRQPRVRVRHVMHHAIVFERVEVREGLERLRLRRRRALRHAVHGLGHDLVLGVHHLILLRGGLGYCLGLGGLGLELHGLVQQRALLGQDRVVVLGVRLLRVVLRLPPLRPVHRLLEQPHLGLLDGLVLGGDALVLVHHHLLHSLQQIPLHTVLVEFAGSVVVRGLQLVP